MGVCSSRIGPAAPLIPGLAGMRLTSRLPGCRNKIDVFAVLFLLLSGFAGGLAYLGHDAARPSPMGLEAHVLGAAVPLALGQGFFQPDVERIPALNAFFDGEVSVLEVGALPLPLPAKPRSAAHSSEFHYYLNHTVALVWRLAGISKESLEPLAAVMLGWTAAAVYGILRLGMGRLLSFLIALGFTFSPPVLYTLPYLRDFSKAPFLLTLFFLLGYLAKRKATSRAIFGWSIFLGCFHGFALGFRQDVLIFLPLVVVVLLFSGSSLATGSTTSGNPRWRFRAANGFLAAVVYLFFFLAAGSPMLGKMEGGADPFHPLVQGSSTKHMQNLGLGPAMYIPLASGHDNYAFATYYHHFRRANNAPEAHFDYDTAGSQQAGRQWLIDLGMCFPADMLSRVYASVFRIIRYADAFTPPLHRETESSALREIAAAHTFLAEHLHRFGLFYAAAALLIISCRAPYPALAILFLLLYICGYSGLQSELRHTFYLCFVPLWILGFLLGCLGKATTGLLVTLCGNGTVPSPSPGRMLRHCFFFAACALAVTLIPLAVLRTYQRQSAASTLTPYIEAARIPQAYEEKTVFNWTCFDVIRPAPLLTAPTSDINALCNIMALAFRMKYPRLLPPRYMVIEFEGSNVPPGLLVRYSSDYPWGNFTQLTRLPRIENPAGSVFHAFPVYEMVSVGDTIRRSCFEGIAVPSAFSLGVKGIYQADDDGSIRFLMPITWSDGDTLSRPFFKNDPSQLPLHQPIEFFPDPVYYDFVEHQPSAFYTAAARASHSGRHAEAALLHSLCLFFSNDPDYRQHLAERLLEEHALDVAFLAVKEHDTLSPELTTATVSLLRRLAEAYVRDSVQTPDPDALDKARSVLEYLLSLGPEHAARNIIELSRPPLRDLSRESWRKTFRDIMILFPDYEGAMFMAFSTLGNLHDVDLDVDLWAQVTRARPDSCQPWRRLGMALERAGARADAVNAYTASLRNCPGDAELERHVQSLRKSDINQSR